MAAMLDEYVGNNNVPGETGLMGFQKLRYDKLSVYQV